MLISMLFVAFTPKGVCASDMSCCDDMEQVLHEEMTTESSTDFLSCCTDNDADDEENQGIADHNCPCHTVITTIILEDIIYNKSADNTEDINTKVKELHSLLAFPIWIPPNIAAEV